jgi:hypothetical protein
MSLTRLTVLKVHPHVREPLCLGATCVVRARISDYDLLDRAGHGVELVPGVLKDLS